ncbi:unnamed protein product [Heligmosomoides polygyrus]|uniref:Uncharacterized protein n=1 Tax=Heligmosomoides polygyrus TaxID=6339 RepID=A0A183GNM5_HELPZ|nr:unnamed protein product [Heligmosomoides polygyrus]
MEKTKYVRLRSHLFGLTVLPALTYASETWALRKQGEHAISVAQRGIERAMLGVTRLTQVREGLRSSELCRRSKIRDAVTWVENRVKSSKIRSHSRDKLDLEVCFEHCPSQLVPLWTPQSPPPDPGFRPHFWLGQTFEPGRLPSFFLR